MTPQIKTVFEINKEDYSIPGTGQEAADIAWKHARSLGKDKTFPKLKGFIIPSEDGETFLAVNTERH